MGETVTKRLDGLMWQRRSDETLAQAIRAAAVRCEEKYGWKPTVALVHSSIELPGVAGVEVRHSPYIASPGLVFVGRET